MGGQRAERRWATGGRWALRPRPRQFLQRRQPWPRREERNVERGGGRRKMGEGRGVAFLQTGRRCPSSCTTPQPRRNSTSTILLGYHDKSRSKFHMDIRHSSGYRHLAAWELIAVAPAQTALHAHNFLATPPLRGPGAPHRGGKEQGKLVAYFPQARRQPNHCSTSKPSSVIPYTAAPSRRRAARLPEAAASRRWFAGAGA